MVLAPEARLTEIPVFVTQVVHEVVLGKDTLLATETPFTSTLAVVALLDPAFAYLQIKVYAPAAGALTFQSIPMADELLKLM